MSFPRVADQHKPGRPMVPSGYGVFYALVSVCFWFILNFLGVGGVKVLALATAVLFGSTMGLFDDLVDLKWRYKAFLPVFAALPLMVLRPADRTTIDSIFAGVLDLGVLFFLLLVPVMVTVIVNSYNMLGGLNGLEAIPGALVLLALAVASSDFLLLSAPLLCLAVLGYFSFTGRAFIGNVGSFSVGLTIASYAIIVNLKLFAVIAMAPFFINSVMILFSMVVLRKKPETFMDSSGRLCSESMRSLRTLLLHFRAMKERRAVAMISLVVGVSSLIAVLST